MHQQRILPRNNLLADHQLATGRHAPTARAERLVQDAAVLDLGQVYDAIRLDLDILEGDGLHEHGGNLG